MDKQITFKIGIVGNTLSGSGATAHQRTRYYEVEGERTLMGAMRATEAAYKLAEVDQARGHWTIQESYSAYLTPNPDATWEVGL